MSDRTGLGPMEVAVLQALDTCGATPDAPYRKSAQVLDALAAASGIPPRPGYRVVRDLARAWVVHLRLVDFHGNPGTPDYGPADARYTECRLTPLGAAAVACERGALGALPIGLANGTTHVGGRQPPLAPERTVAALRAAADGADDREIVRLLGPPSFPTGCQVGGDVAGLAAGRTVHLTLTATVLVDADDRLVITDLPPDVGASHIARDLMDAGDLPAIGDVDDETSGLDGPSRVIVRLRSGADPAAAAEVLRQRWGVRTTLEAGFGRPVAELARGWIEAHGRADLEVRLSVIEAAIAREQHVRARPPRPASGRTTASGYRPR